MKSLKISTRLGLGLSFLLLLQLLVAGLGLRQMDSLADRMDFLTEVGEAKLYALSEVQFAVGIRAVAARNIVLVPEPSAQRAELELANKMQGQIDKGLSSLSVIMGRPGAASAQEKRMLEELLALEARYKPIAGRVVQFAQSLEIEAAKRRAAFAAETSDSMSRRAESLKLAPRHVECLWGDRKPGHDGRGAGAPAKGAVAHCFMRGLAPHFIAHGTTKAATLAFCIHRRIVGTAALQALSAE